MVGDRGEARVASVRLPGTCGEWVQGTLDGVPCLVSCAIDWFAEVAVSLDPAASTWEVPPDAPKAAVALRLALSARGVATSGGRLKLTNPLPRGRGYASSTADVAGAIYAVGRALGAPFRPEEAAALAVRVEPSDSTVFPGLALFAHRDARFHRVWGCLPPLEVVVLDPGGEVDTLAFNACDHHAALVRLASEHRDAFQMMEAGVVEGDACLIAAAATLSARAHQAVLYSPLVEECLALAPRLGALGVVRAHSGTLAGLICLPEDGSALAARAADRFRGIAVYRRRCLGEWE